MTSVTVTSTPYEVSVSNDGSLVTVASTGPAGPAGSAFTPAADSGSGSSVSGSLTIAGGTNITTSVDGTVVTVNASGGGTVTGVQATSPIVSDGNSTSPTISHATTLAASQLVSFVTQLGVNTSGHVTSLVGVDAAGMRNALDLKNSAVLNVGSAVGTVAAGDDSRLSDARTPVAHSTDLLTTGTLPVGRGGTGVTSLPMVSIPAAADAEAARAILELGTAALAATGTGDANVILGNDARLTNARTPSSTLDHDASKITTGTLVVGRGGTGLTSVSTLLNSNTTKSDVGLSAVENTAVSTWAGSESITTTGTVGTGVWNATAILDTKIDLRVDHGVTFDGGGSVIESGKVVYVPVERAGVIKAATLVADASGAITITITRYDPDADATTLGGSAAVGSIALATKIINRDTTLSVWTLAVAEGDVLAFTTGGTIATVTRVTCKLKVELA